MTFPPPNPIMKSLLLCPLFVLSLSLPAVSIPAQTVRPLDEAQTALQGGDLTKAESLLAPLTGAEAKDAAAFFVLGQLRERQRSLKDAVAAYEQAAALDPTKPEYFSALGIAFSQRMGELNFMQQAMTAGKMRKAFEKSVALDARHVAGLIGLARYYTNAPEIAGGSLEKAKEFAGRVRDLSPFLGETELGNIAEKGEDFPAALAHFETASRLKPDHAGLQVSCGRMLAKLSRKEEARARFEGALKLNPGLERAKQELAALDGPAAAP